MFRNFASAFPFVLFVLLALLPARTCLGSWPTTPEAGLPLGGGPDQQDLLATCSDDSGGFWVAFWMDSAALPKLRLQHVDALGARAFGNIGLPVNDHLGTVSLTSLLLAPDGGVFVAWVARAEGVSYDLWAQRFSPQGDPLWGTGGIRIARGPDVVVAVGNGGLIARSMDGGETWSEPASPTGESQLGVVVESFRIRTAGDNGSFLLSEDHGATWTVQPSGSAADVNALDTRSSRGIAVGDGGQTWNQNSVTDMWEAQPVAPVTTDFLGVSYLAGVEAVAVGRDGRIARTSDNGATWQERPSGVTQHLHDVCFPTPEVGTAVGNAGTILRSTDGGDTWTPQTSPTSANLLAVDFLDEDFGIATGYSGVALYTHDGGDTWTVGSTPVVLWYMGVSITDHQTAIAVGQDRTIIKTVDGGVTWSLRQAPTGTRDLWEVSAPSNPVYQAYPELVDDGAGGVILLWSDQVSGPYQVYAQRLDGNGSALWPDPVAISDSSGGAGSCRAVARGGGGALVVWLAPGIEDGDTFLYAQAIDGEGNLLASEPVVVSDHPSLKRDLQLVPDGSGGAMAGWQDWRANGGIIYGSRITSDGGTHWGFRDGLPVAVAALSQQKDFALAPDPAGGAYYVWAELRSQGTGVFAQRVDQLGNPGWPQDVRVHDASTDEERVAATADGLGGIVCAWLDNRTAGRDIRAQGVDRSGDLRWPDAVALLEGADGAVAYTSEPVRLLPDGQGGAYASWQFHPSLGPSGPQSQAVDRHGFLGRPAANPSDAVDVPGDQGGAVTLSWEASYLDAFPHQVVTEYSVWRRQGPSAKWIQASERERSTREALDAGLSSALVSAQAASGWVYVATTPALYLPSYGMDVPTYGTGSAPVVQPTEFQVITHTADPWVNWISTPLAGNSLDNLAPPAPLSLLAIAGTGIVQLTWTDGVGHVEDIGHYRVYRGHQSGFALDAGSFVGQVTQRDFLDPDPGGPTPYYRVTAVDVHDNEGMPSPEAGIVFSTAAGDDTRVGFQLEPPFPNPSRGATRVRFSLPAASPVRMDLYDLAGRRVHGEDLGRLAAGWHERALLGRTARGERLANGTYFLQISHGSTRQTTKLVLKR